jgi:hypothetical protein
MYEITLKLETEIRYHKERIRELEKIVSRETKKSHSDKLFSAGLHLAFERASLEIKQRELARFFQLCNN